MALFLMSRPRVFLKKSGSQLRKPPDGIGEEFAGDERPGLAVFQQGAPRGFGDAGVGVDLIGVALDVRELVSAETGGFPRETEEGDPEGEPEEAGCTGGDEGGLPAPGERDPGDDGGGGDRTDVGAGVEDAGG